MRGCIAMLSLMTRIGSIAAAVFAIGQIGTVSAQTSEITDAIGDTTWQGSTICNGEKVYVTLYVETLTDPTRMGTRMELRHSPSDPPYARGFGSAQYQRKYGAYDRYMTFTPQYWSFRPMSVIKNNPPTPGLGPGAKFEMSEDGNTLSKAFPRYLKPEQRAPGACPEPTLAKVPAVNDTRGITSAMDLPREFAGTYGCYGRAPTYYSKLFLEPVSDRDVEGTVIIQDVKRQNQPGAYRVFGEFDGQTGKLNLVGDGWIKPVRYENTAFDMFVTLKDGAQRLVGGSGARHCGNFDFSVPGYDHASNITGPILPSEIMTWENPSTCVAFATWYEQAVRANNNRSPYYQTPAWDINVGLFADERFVPFFGKPFSELTADERKHLTDLSKDCTRQLAFTQSNLGSDFVISRYLPDHASAQWSKVTKFRLLRKRLSSEMAELEARDVGEADLPELETTLANIDNRFSELWPTDKELAREVLNAKIDVALGKLADRLDDSITNLPVDLSAFMGQRMIRAEIARLGERRQDDKQRLTTKLDKRLTTITDALLGEIAGTFASVDPDIGALGQLSSKINRVTQTAGEHTPTKGMGLTMLKGVVTNYAETVLPDFKSQTTAMIDQSAEFEQREFQFSGVLNFNLRLVPNAPQFEQAFRPYFQHVETLRPEPRLDDLVQEDGSPTNYGAKLAMSDWLGTQTMMMDAFLPYGSFMSDMMRISSVSNIDCTVAEEGGYWCDYDVRFSSQWLPFMDAVGGLPGRIRFKRRGMYWTVAETANQGRSYSGGASYQDNSWQEQWNDLTLEGLQFD